jgi:hypothetical protein
MAELVFTKKSFKEFIKLYKDCPENGVFIFQGHEVLKSYAKYLIEHVKNQIKL